VTASRSTFCVVAWAFSDVCSGTSWPPSIPSMGATRVRRKARSNVGGSGSNAALSTRPRERRAVTEASHSASASGGAAMNGGHVAQLRKRPSNLAAGPGCAAPSQALSATQQVIMSGPLQRSGAMASTCNASIQRTARSHAPTMAPQLATSTSHRRWRASHNSSKANSQRPAAAHAASAAPWTATFGSTRYRHGMCARRSNEPSHAEPFSQAAAAAPQHAALGQSPERRISRSKYNAIDQRVPRSQALIEAPKLTTSGLRPNDGTASQRSAKDRCHCAPRAHALIAALIAAISGQRSPRPHAATQPRLRSVNAFSHAEARPQASSAAPMAILSGLRIACSSHNDHSQTQLSAIMKRHAIIEEARAEHGTHT